MPKKLKNKRKWVNTTYEEAYHYYDSEASNDINYTKKLNKESINYDRKTKKYGRPNQKTLGGKYDLSLFDDYKGTGEADQYI